jgi:ribosomal protein S20
MPAKSKSQQKAAGAALAAKRGDMPKSQLKGASKKMEESMSEAELEEYAGTDRKDLPEKKD